MDACENERGVGGHLGLTGNLFLPFSWNKGRDRLCCVMTAISFMLGNNDFQRPDSKSNYIKALF